MTKLLKKLLGLHATGNLTKEAYDAIADADKEALHKEVEGITKYNALSATLKTFSKTDGEDGENGDGDSDGVERGREGEDSDDDDSDDSAEKAKKNAEAEAYKKALADKMKEMDFGITDHSTTSKGTKETNARLRKALMGDGKGGTFNLLGKAFDGSNFLSISIAEKIFTQPETPTRLVDAVYTKRIEGSDTARFNEMGRTEAAIVAPGATVTYGDDPSVTKTDVRLQKYSVGIRVLMEEIRDTNFDLQSVLMRNGVNAIRRKVEADLIGLISANLPATQKVKIAAGKGSAANNWLRAGYQDVIGFGSVIAELGESPTALVASSSALRNLVGRTVNSGLPVFSAEVSNALRPASISGVPALASAGMLEHTELVASTTDDTIAMLFSEWSETCAVAFDADLIRVESTYNPANDVVDIGVFQRAAPAMVSAKGIAALTISTA